MSEEALVFILSPERMRELRAEASKESKNMSWEEIRENVLDRGPFLLSEPDFEKIKTRFGAKYAERYKQEYDKEQNGRLMQIELWKKDPEEWKRRQRIRMESKLTIEFWDIE